MACWGRIGHWGFKELPLPWAPRGHWEVTVAEGHPVQGVSLCLPAEAMHLCGDSGLLTGTVSTGDQGMREGIRQFPGREGRRQTP